MTAFACVKRERIGELYENSPTPVPIDANAYLYTAKKKMEVWSVLGSIMAFVSIR